MESLCLLWWVLLALYRLAPASPLFCPIAHVRFLPFGVPMWYFSSFLFPKGGLGSEKMVKICRSRAFLSTPGLCLCPTSVRAAPYKGRWSIFPLLVVLVVDAGLPSSRSFSPCATAPPFRFSCCSPFFCFCGPPFSTSLLRSRTFFSWCLLSLQSLPFFYFGYLYVSCLSRFSPLHMCPCYVSLGPPFPFPLLLYVEDPNFGSL